MSLYGDKNWSTIAKRLKSRRGKQCRERWHNHLDPSVIKTPWTKEEDLIIIKCHCMMGPRWAQIAKFLPGRYNNCFRLVHLCFVFVICHVLLFKDMVLTVKFQTGEFACC